MRKLFLTLILFLCCLAGFAQEPVEVMVLMKDQYNRAELCRKAEFDIIQDIDGDKVKTKKIVIR